MSVGQQVDVCGGVDTHRDVHVAAVVDSTVGSWEQPRLGPMRPVISNWATGWGHTVEWSGSGWRAPAVTAPA